MKFYIATSLKNVDQHNEIRDLLQEGGGEITYDWTTHEGGQEDEVADLKLAGIQAAGLVVVVFPAGVETYAELGAALAYGKIVALLADAVEWFFIKKQRKCAFCHHCNVIHCTHPTELVNILERLEAAVNTFAATVAAIQAPPVHYASPVANCTRETIGTRSTNVWADVTCKACLESQP